MIYFNRLEAVRYQYYTYFIRKKTSVLKDGKTRYFSLCYLLSFKYKIYMHEVHVKGGMKFDGILEFLIIKSVKNVRLADNVYPNKLKQPLSENMTGIGS